MTRRLRQRLAGDLSLERLLPDRQPEYVRSSVYLFGALTLASLAWLVASGIVLAAFGPTWWHVSRAGRFVNSVHFWCVQVFFFSMVLHLWAQFFMGAWRGGRRATWAVGAVTFVVAISAAFTGYLSQQNLDSQWIAVQGKDTMNAIGVGAYFNLLNFGQMYGFHVLILPLAVALLVGLHLVLVRRHGPVPPYPETRRP